MPVYNAEHTLERCVRSILNQSFRNFELILVDDGSSDASLKLCNMFAEKDKRVYVVHQENDGVSSARNAGIRLASGKYLMFCDSDDFVSCGWCEILYRIAQNNTNAFPLCALCTKENLLSTKKYEGNDFSLREYKMSESNDLHRLGVTGYIVSGIFERAVIEEHEIYFCKRKGEVDYNEDLMFFLEYARCKSILAFYEGALYCYCTREGSLSRENKEPKQRLNKYLEKFLLWKEFFDIYHNDEGVTDVADEILYEVLLYLADAIKRNESYKKVKACVSNQDVLRVLEYASGKREDPRLIYLIKQKHTALLWIYLKLSIAKKIIR